MIQVNLVNVPGLHSQTLMSYDKSTAPPPQDDEGPKKDQHVVPMQPHKDTEK